MNFKKHFMQVSRLYFRVNKETGGKGISSVVKNCGIKRREEEKGARKEARRCGAGRRGRRCDKW